MGIQVSPISCRLILLQLHQNGSSRCNALVFDHECEILYREGGYAFEIIDDNHSYPTATTNAILWETFWIVRKTKKDPGKGGI